MEKNKYLLDVAFIRLVLIVLLILYHSLCPFVGGWDLPYSGFPSISTYKWIGLLAHDFQLEMMVFISGLLLGYVITLKPERLTANYFIVKKAKRILIPSILFSIIYYLIFFDLNEPIYYIVLKILKGCGHLWFLPMLFWCFALCYIVEYKNYPPRKNIYNMHHSDTFR